MDKIVAVAPAKITQIREAGRKALSPMEFEQLNGLINQLAIYGLTPYINSELGRLMSKFGWELEVEESPEWTEALIACDVAFLGAELKEMCRENGMSDYGHKKELCRRLYNAKVEEVVEIMKPIIERGVSTEGKPSYLKEPFIKVGDRVRYIGSIKGHSGTWPEGVWLEKGVEGIVTEYHPRIPAPPIPGEMAIEAWAQVKFDNGATFSIGAEDEGRRWERI